MKVATHFETIQCRMSGDDVNEVMRLFNAVCPVTMSMKSWDYSMSYVRWQCQCRMSGDNVNEVMKTRHYVVACKNKLQRIKCKYQHYKTVKPLPIDNVSKGYYAIKCFGSVADVDCGTDSLSCWRPTNVSEPTLSLSIW